MKRILFLLTGLILLVACQENVEPKDPEFDNWKARNEAAFKTQLNVARQNIASAKAQYGNAWEANCDYRLMRKFSLTDQSQVKYRDTLCVQRIAILYRHGANQLYRAPDADCAASGRQTYGAFGPKRGRSVHLQSDDVCAGEVWRQLLARRSGHCVDANAHRRSLASVYSG